MSQSDRPLIVGAAIRIPFVRGGMLTTITGLDHELPDLSPRGPSRTEPAEVMAGRSRRFT